MRRVRSEHRCSWTVPEVLGPRKLQRQHKRVRRKNPHTYHFISFNEAVVLLQDAGKNRRLPLGSKGISRPAERVS
jgi:hypothetical protein